MAVYTEISDDDLRNFIDHYDIGPVVSCKGIAEGVENSNFLLRTAGNAYILTIYEKRVQREDLPFFLGLMDHLAAKGISCPIPIQGLDGSKTYDLCGKPAAIVSFLEGIWPRHPTPDHCRAVGKALAALHKAGADFSLRRPNDLSLQGWKRLAGKTVKDADSLEIGLGAFIEDELLFLEEQWPSSLEKGIIHADLFPDNVFFLDDRLSGLIDFYFACSDFLAYDLAVCLNAWCFDASHQFDFTKARALVQGYESFRPLPQKERDSLPILCRGSALRFMLTRLYDWLHHPADAFVKPKDPLEYRRKLDFHRRQDSSAAYGID